MMDLCDTTERILAHRYIRDTELPQKTNYQTMEQPGDVDIRSGNQNLKRMLEEISLGKQTGPISVQWFLSGYWFLSGHFQFGRRTERSVEVNEEIMWINISQI